MTDLFLFKGVFIHFFCIKLLGIPEFYESQFGEALAARTESLGILFFE